MIHKIIIKILMIPKTITQERTQTKYKYNLPLKGMFEISSVDHVSHDLTIAK